MLSVSAHQTFHFAQTDYSVKVMNILMQADNRKATKELPEIQFCYCICSMSQLPILMLTNVKLTEVKLLFTFKTIRYRLEL